MNHPLSAKQRDAFTLIELLVSTVILVLLLLVMVSITDSTRKVWSYTSGRIEQFRDAREAFETVTRNLSQATLNTYWDYQRDSSGNPMTSGTNSYVRQSELRFISGLATSLTGTNTTNTHAVFCQIPLGIVANSGTYANMNNLLNTCGYFIEFGSDISSRPPFFGAMSNRPALRYRFRLMEMIEPSDSLELYKRTSGKSVYTGGAPGQQYIGLEWFTTPLNKSPRPARVVAENIVAMVLLPKLTSGDQAGNYTDASLAPDFFYSSTGVDTNGNPLLTVSGSDANLNPVNQLPPVMQVTLVAVDEASFNRFLPSVSDSSPAPAMPDLGLSNLFLHATNYEVDLKQLQTNLLNAKLSYRIFSTNVSLKAAKWSRIQK